MLRQDIIAHEVYDDVVMWWTLAKKNEYRYIFDEMTPGQVLKIPTISEVSEAATVELKKKKR